MTLPEPSAFAVTNHREWIGRKEAALRRRQLDCDCPNRGEVFFHLWCDRLACREHADAEHDCDQFKGKSGIEEESAPVRAVGRAELLAGLRYDPGTSTTLCDGAGGVWEIPVNGDAPRRVAPSLAEMNAASAAVRARRHGFSTTHWGGITGWRTICACQQGFGEESWHEHAHEHGVDPHGRHLDGTPCPCLTRCEQADPPAPPVDEHFRGQLTTFIEENDEALARLSDGPSPHHVDTAAGSFHLIGAGESMPETPCDCPKPVPWWRRMLGGDR
jgi:hypothetical protein